MIDGFHWANHLFFTRQPDGSIRIRKWPHPNDAPNLSAQHAVEYTVGWEETPPVFDFTIPLAEWASIVTSMTVKGETYERWEWFQKWCMDA